MSMVFFNMASMFQSSETGFDTLWEAKLSGAQGTSDFMGTAQQAFAKLGTAVEVPH